METTPSHDAELVHQSLAGSHPAFGQIVARYQSLVCSLAYSATGSLSRSEDLAQETFLAAWRQLAQLREPEKLRPWLCGIVRNLACDAVRRDGREPSHRAESLAEVAESSSPEPLPPDYTISHEEQAILWRAIEQIPETYREPLILFYREHQSIEVVARNLEVSEDAVKQRLSRGRKMLHEQMLAFVEDALERTSPGQVFTLSVLGALPAVTFSAKAAAVGTALKGGAGAKTAGLAGLWGVCLGPLLVFVPNYIAYRVALAGTHSDAERAGVKSLYGKLGAITAGIFLPLAGLVLWFTRGQTDRSWLTGFFACLLVVIFVPTMFLLVWRTRGQARAYLQRILREEYAGALPEPAWEYRSRLGFLGLPLVHVRLGDRFGNLRKPVKAWIAISQSAIGGLFACGGFAVAPVSVGGLSVGLLSFGAVSVGLMAIGGIAAGVWPLFGGLVVGWQSFGGCFALGWHAAVGNFALAHDFALGHFAVAAQANNPAAQVLLEHNFFCQCADFLNRHWLWLNAFWAVPIFVQWLASMSPRKPAAAARLATGLLIPFLLASVFLSAGCNKSGALGKASKGTVPTGPVAFQQHWQAGGRVVKSFELTMTSEIPVPGRPDPIKQAMAFRQEWAISVLKNNPDGSHEGELELLKFRLKLDQDGRNVVEYDSETKPADAGASQAAAAWRQALSKMTGARVQFRLDVSNRVDRMDGVEELRNRLATGGANDATAGVRSMFNEGYLRQMIGDSQSLPANPVQPGDSWPVHTDLSLSDLGGMAADYEFNFQSWEYRGQRLCARQEFQGTLKGQADTAAAPSTGLRMALQDGTVSGTSWFDVELGLVIEANLTQDLTMNIITPAPAHGGAGGLTLIDRMHQTIAIKLESVK